LPKGLPVRYIQRVSVMSLLGPDEGGTFLPNAFKHQHNQKIHLLKHF
jgi:hypothetical protein